MIFIFKNGHRINVVKGQVSNSAIIFVGVEAVIRLLLPADMDHRSNCIIL